MVIGRLVEGIRARQAFALPWAARISALLGGVFYFLQTFFYAHNQISILDEGAYLFKGYLFASGRYIPFQDYGPWGNHMPLSFLIPGYIQTVFGPGVRTGRYFAILLGLLLLVGLWVVARRLGGNWWAAAAVWAVALNPALARIYGTGISQGLAACMLVWILVLVVDEQAPAWRLALGSGLAGVLLLTRINMAPVLPVLVLYVFWQHGRRNGMIAALAGGLVVLGGHAPYFPGILRIWAKWLPGAVTPFLDAWRIVDGGAKSWNPDVSLNLRWLSFWYAVRVNFLPMVGALAFGLLWLGRRHWKNDFYFKVSAFLSLLFAVLFAAHAWATLANNYCVFCFQGYLAFFGPIGLLLIIVTFKGWEGGRQAWFSWFAVALILLVSTGVGFGAYEQVSPWLLELPIPRIKGGQIMEGSVPLWGMIQNGLGIERKVSRWLLPTMAGLASGAGLLLLVWGASRTRRGQPAINRSAGLLALSAFLAVGLVFSPSRVFAGGLQENDCTGDVIAAQESAGRYLASVLPAGAQVYWQGTLSTAPLLYAPWVEIYPPQINNGYSFHIGGDADELEKFGLWNAELAQEWKEEANYIIVEERRYNAEWKAFLESGRFEELERSPTTAPCKDDASLRVFRRKSP